jgi:dipeptidyl aminopeptidase/acylaminoacyl peptidase
VQPEVYLAHLTATGITGPLVNISNSPGYDSQPSFLPDGSAILFSSQREGTQYDIYRYDIASKRLSQVTHSEENENSPLVMPGGKTFSAVRTEMDRTQRLWKFDLDGSNARVLLENVKPVGYHVWIDTTHVALYVLGTGREPAMLQIADITTGMADIIDTGIGRALLMDPVRTLLTYIKTSTGQPAVIKQVDPRTRAITEFATVAAPNSQDAVFSRDGRFYMAHGAIIEAIDKARSPKTGAPTGGWSKIADLSNEAITNITRLAISPDGKWIAIVAEPVSK